MKKISVMIVDDEKLAIDDLKSIIDWEEYGFEIITTAVNGKQALSKFQKYHPQVVLTDIKMPYMDGIELIRHLREIDTKTKILLLTAYKDFSYAKSAIQYGITDYIIKSEINSQSFKEKLFKLRKTIDSEDKALNILKQKRIADYFNSNMDEVQVSDEELFFTPYCYLIIEQDLPINITGDNFIEYDIYQNTDIILTLVRIEEGDPNIIAVSGIQHDQILIVIDIKENSQNKIRQTLFKYAEKIKCKLNERFQSTFTIFIDDISADLTGLKKMLSSRERFLAKFLLGNGEIYNLSDNRLEAEQGDIDVDGSLLNSLVEKMDSFGLRSNVGQLFDRIFAINSYTNLYNTSRSLYDILRRHNDQLPDHEKLNINAKNNWNHWLNAKDIKRWFNDRFQMLVTEKKRVYESCYSKAIIKAIDFIYKNYSKNNLSINSIADSVHLSTGHLCAMFKKETGKTLNNYITEVRINEAKRLLHESDRKVYDISSAVGYQSSQYFSQVFYKITGVYPAEYQKKR